MTNPHPSIRSSFFLLLLLAAFLIFQPLAHSEAAASSKNHRNSSGEVKDGEVQQFVPGEVKTAPWKDGPRFIVLPKENNKDVFTAKPEKIDGEWIAYADVMAVARDAFIEEDDEEIIWEEAGIFLKESNFSRRYLDDQKFVNLRIDSSAETIEFFNSNISGLSGKHSFKIGYNSYEYLELLVDGHYAAILVYDADTILFDMGLGGLVLRRKGASRGVEGKSSKSWLEAGTWQFNMELSDLMRDREPVDYTSAELNKIIKEARKRNSEYEPNELFEPPKLVFQLDAGLVQAMITEYGEEEKAELDFEVFSRFKETFFCSMDDVSLTLTFLDKNNVIISSSGMHALFNLTGKNK